MLSKFSEYTASYISGTMSLRTPQKKSLEILDEILSSINLTKNMNLKVALAAVNAICPTCTDFERDFMSLTFALATGVGKTRLMGAFIAYLYTNHNIKNFFVVAPNKTVYEKLKSDFGNVASEKYVFKGLGCFTNPPQIICDDDYRNKTVDLFPSGINLYIFNIDKFNKESSKMKSINEYLGKSFFEYLSSLPDLVLLMDESHHYRAERGTTSLNELKPILGLETTATPVVNKGGKQFLFKNVAYEYPLSQAIADGYTRTPFAVTRKDIKLEIYVAEKVPDTYKKIQGKYIPIPIIKITDNGVEEYKFTDFDLDVAEFTQVPVSNELYVQNLIDMKERGEIRNAEKLDFESLNPTKVLLDLLREKSEINYNDSECAALLRKLIKQLFNHYAKNYSENEIRNIVMMYRKDIVQKIYDQMLKHFYRTNSLLEEEVMSVSGANIMPNCNYSVECDLYENFKEKWNGNIKSVRFSGIEKGVFSSAVFDSEPELVLSRVMEKDNDVLRWLRPSKEEFNIFYNHGKRYEPDFVIETKDIVYLTEVKGEDKLKDADVIAKKERGIQFCKTVSEWARANDFKKWRYLFIPSMQIKENSSFENLAKRFVEFSEGFFQV